MSERKMLLSVDGKEHKTTMAKMKKALDEFEPQSVRVESPNQDKELREILTYFGCDFKYKAGTEKIDGTDNFTEDECVEHYIQAISHLIAEARDKDMAINSAAIQSASKKLRKLRLTDVSGCKEHPSVTVKSVIKDGLGGLYDDEVIDYILQFGVKYYLTELSNLKKGKQL